jgi:protein-S-isoprenylcysteine O-methyltransferase Ste14
MLAYGALHTLMAGWLKPRFVARFGQRAYHGLYRMVFNVVSVVSAMPIAALVILAERGIIWQIPLRYEPLLLTIQLIGLIGMAASLLQIDGGRFLGIPQMKAYLAGQPLPLPDEPLKTDGLYGLVRHPLYLFSLLVIWPVPVMREAYFGACLGITLYFIVGSFYEERRLLAAFGQQYADYQQRVPRLIPFWPRFATKKAA